MNLNMSSYFNVAASDHQMEVAQSAESRPSEVAGLASPASWGSLGCIISLVVTPEKP